MKRSMFMAMAFSIAATGAAIGSALTGQAHAQEEWPARPVTLVVPFGAGGVSDLANRVVASVLSRKIGQSVVVENRPGAGGVVGVESVANGPNDGYTILYATSGPFSILPAMQPGKLPFDPVNDFEQIRGFSSAGQLIVAHPDAPYDTIAELVEYAKANPGKLSFGSPGIGVAQHLAGELFKSATGTDMLHIPYRVGTNQMVDLMSGVIDLSFEYAAVVGPYISDGKMKAIGITSVDRAEAYPEVETVVEAGYPDAVNLGWGSIAVAAGTPKDIRDKLSAALGETLSDPEVTEYFRANGQSSLGNLDQEGITAFLKDALARFERVVREANIAEQLE